MREFILLFRQPSFDYSIASPIEVQALSKRWKNWWKNIEAQGKLESRGPRLDNEGKVLKSSGIITDRSFVEIREILESFIIVKAKNLENAVTLTHGCPELDQGGNIEVRPVY